MGAQLLLVPLDFFYPLPQSYIEADGLVNLQLGLLSDFYSIFVQHLFQFLELINKVADIVDHQLFLFESACEMDVLFDGAGIGLELVIQAADCGGQRIALADDFGGDARCDSCVLFVELLEELLMDFREVHKEYAEFMLVLDIA